MQSDMQRFTLTGPLEAESRIAADQRLIGDAVVAAVPTQSFGALILAGGYGRGEGAYRRHGERFGPYNDYDYFVLVRATRRAAKRIAERLGRLAHELEQSVGVEVDFAILRESELHAMPVTLMNAELRSGHRVIRGASGMLLEGMPTMPLCDVPLSEFVRLLLNRGALLLMNRRLLDRGTPLSESEREQFARYLDKALLACGDARLAAARRYDSSCVVKREVLGGDGFPASEAFKKAYAGALDRRFGAEHCVVPESEEESALRETIAHWLESLAQVEAARAGARPLWHSYCSPDIDKGQAQAHGLPQLAKNVLVTIRDFGAVELLRRPVWSTRYPRERLVSTLPGLLAPELGMPLGALGAALGLSAHEGMDFAGLSSRFLAHWRRYN